MVHDNPTVAFDTVLARHNSCAEKIFDVEMRLFSSKTGFVARVRWVSNSPKKAAKPLGVSICGALLGHVGFLGAKGALG